MENFKIKETLHACTERPWQRKATAEEAAKSANRHNIYVLPLRKFLYFFAVTREEK
jgi:hypothetical protein